MNGHTQHSHSEWFYHIMNDHTEHILNGEGKKTSVQRTSPRPINARTHRLRCPLPRKKVIPRATTTSSSVFDVLYNLQSDTVPLLYDSSTEIVLTFEVEEIHLVGWSGLVVLWCGGVVICDSAAHCAAATRIRRAAVRRSARWCVATARRPADLQIRFPSLLEILLLYIL